MEWYEWKIASTTRVEFNCNAAMQRTHHVLHLI